jgi:hypothetical protein
MILSLVTDVVFLPNLFRFHSPYVHFSDKHVESGYRKMVTVDFIKLNFNIA